MAYSSGGAFVARPEATDHWHRNQNDEDEMRAVAQGRQPGPEDAESPSFESAEALLRLLNPENRALLALIDSERPQSLADLAKLSGRAESNLSRTLGKLVAMGVIRLVEGQGRSKVAELLVRKLVVEIDVCQPRDRIAGDSTPQQARAAR